MKFLKDVLKETQMMFYRFQIFIIDENGFKKTVGAAYLQEGQTIYTLRLWTFLNDRFFLIPSKEDPKRFKLMTREPNTSSKGKNKYFWNVVGSANADAAQRVVEMDFDLIDKKIYMSIFPEPVRTNEKSSSHVEVLAA